MKVYYLSMRNFGGGYSLDDGIYGIRRIDLGSDLASLIKGLEANVNKERKNTVIYVVQDNFPKESLNKVRSLFSKSKVKVALKPFKDIS